MQTTYPRTRRWTRVEYDRLIDQGVFQPGERLELLAGQLVLREPQGPTPSLSSWFTKPSEPLLALSGASGLNSPWPSTTIQSPSLTCLSLQGPCTAVLRPSPRASHW